MGYKVEKLEGSMAKLIIDVSAEEFDAACEKAYQKNKKRISVPGFRAGKVPKAMIEKMYGKEVFYEDAANIIIPDAYEKTYDEAVKERFFKGLRSDKRHESPDFDAREYGGSRGRQGV